VGAHQHTFCSHLKTRFKQKFRPKYALKCVIFEKNKTVKIISESKAPPPDPRIVTYAYYYDFVELVELFLWLNAF